jgi:hypothetical protein
MRRRVNAPRAAAHHRHAHVGELIRQLARRLDAVMRRHAASRPSPRRFCPSRQRALDVKHERRVVNFAEQRGIIFIRLKLKRGSRIPRCVSIRPRGQRIFPRWKWPRPLPRRYCGRRSSSDLEAARIFGASPKCSSNCRTRTGPTCSIMFSATNASRESMHGLKSFNLQVSSSKFVGDEVTSLKFSEELVRDSLRRLLLFPIGGRGGKNCFALDSKFNDK